MSKAMPQLQSSQHKLETPIRNFSKERYISVEWAEREWAGVWRKNWQAAAHISDLRTPGDFLVYDIGAESILISCTDEGQIKAFYNVCQHRGVRLEDNHCGHSNGFRCPYHSWRYSNNGDLTHVPARDTFQGGLPLEQLGLPPVNCDLALGFVWICLDPEAEPLQQYLEDILPLMAHYEIENMKLTLDQTVAVNCNWKAVHDNFSELYHVHYLHPQHRRFVDCSNAVNELYPRGHTRVCVPGGTTDSLFSQPQQATDVLSMQLSALGLEPVQFDGRVADIKGAIRDAKRELGNGDIPYYNNFSDGELTDVYQTNVFPNCIFTHQPEMCWLIRVRPHPVDPNRCYLDKLSLERFPEHGEDSAEGTADVELHKITRHGGDEPGGDRPPHESFDYQDVITGHRSMTDTIDQDLSLLSHAQQGMQSEGFQRLWLNEIECRIAHFHQRLEQCVADSSE